MNCTVPSPSSRAVASAIDNSGTSLSRTTTVLEAASASIRYPAPGSGLMSVAVIKPWSLSSSSVLRSGKGRLAVNGLVIVNVKSVVRFVPDEPIKKSPLVLTSMYSIINSVSGSMLAVSGNPILSSSSVTVAVMSPMEITGIIPVSITFTVAL